MKIFFRALAALLPLLLTACFSQDSAPTAAPQNLAVTAGDGRVTVTWDDDTNLTYWIYYNNNTDDVPTGSLVSKSNYTGIIYNRKSPTYIDGLTNGKEYSFLVTASDGSSSTGPASAVVSRTPRPIGSTIDWILGDYFTTNTLTGIAYGGIVNKFVAVGVDGTVFQATRSYTGTGGVTDDNWTAATLPTLPAPYDSDLSAVIHDGTSFVALGSDGTIITSSDAETWTTGTAVGVAAMNSIAHGGGSNYVAVGNGGVIYRTTTGVSSGAWSLQTSGTTQNLYGVSYLNGGFIAVGAGGTLLTSADGATWTARTSNTANNLRQVAYGASTYVAVGDAGTVVYSTDAITWTVTIITAESLRTICFANAQFIAAGTTGTVAFSANGQTGWTVGDAGVTDTLNSIVPTDVLIAVGNAGVNVSVK